MKQFGIGLAAGIIFDATVIRALLVPSLMRLMGEWNWWMPRPRYLPQFHWELLACGAPRPPARRHRRAHDRRG